MLHFVVGNFWDQPAEVRVNTVNCVGVMGKGVALQFKRRYPAMFLDYRRACQRGEVRPGGLHIYQALDCVVVNFPTKRHWRDDSRIEDVESGLLALAGYLRARNGARVTLPALGCGHGGLDWSRVRALIYQYLVGLDAEIWCYSPEDSRRDWPCS